MSTASDQQSRAILDAATQLLSTGGADALRVRDIAAAASCSTMGVYSRFGGKDGVIEAIFVDGFRSFTQALLSEPSEPAEHHARRLGLAYRTWALANPEPYKIMFTEAVPGFSPSDEALMVASAAFQVLIDAVLNAQQAALFRGGNPVEIAWALWGLTHGLVMLELRTLMPPQVQSSAEAMYELGLDAVIAGFEP